MSILVLNILKVKKLWDIACKLKLSKLGNLNNLSKEYFFNDLYKNVL